MATDDARNQKLSTAFPERNKEGELQIIPISDSTFDMTAILAAAQTYVRLNESVNSLIGMEVRWFRAVPQQRSQDVIFQEYTLSNVEDEPLCLKVVLPEGNFPDSRYNYDIMGLEYQVPLEIHIDKIYWESFAGFGTAPQKKDVVYFAVPNKLYQVESSYLLRGFMEQETTWKCNLIKYMPEASRREGIALQETVNKYTVSEAEIFGEAIQSDIDKITNDKQMSPFNTTERDKYKTLDSKLQIINAPINIFGTIVAESYYDLNTSDVQDAVIYDAGDLIKISSDRCLTTWTKIVPLTTKEYEVTSIIVDSSATIPLDYKITFSTPNKGFEIGDTFIVSRPGALNFYATLVDDTSIRNNTYDISIDETVVKHLISVKSNWTAAKGYKMKIQEPVSLIDGVNGKDYGVKVDIYANQYIKLIYGSQEYISISTDRLLDNKWYAYVINIGNTWDQYNMYIWEQSATDTGDKLRKTFYDTVDFTPEQTIVDYYSINKSPSYMTNIRLYTSTMEEEKQINELLSYFVKDSNQAILLDNVDLKVRMPYIGAQR